MFLHLLATFFHHFAGIALCGAVAAVPDLSGGASDVPDLTGGESDGLPGSEGGQPTEEVQGEGEAVQETEEGGEGETEKPESNENRIDWRTVPQAVKGHLQALAKDPGTAKLANMLQNAVYTSQTMLKEFPGGLKEAQALKGAVDAAGGIEEIQGLQSVHRQLVEDQEALDNKARSGDVSVIDNLMEIAGPGFSKLMPNALDKWVASDKEGYSHTMSKIMVGAMMEGNVIAEMNTAYKMLSLNNPQATKLAMESLNKVSAWFNNIGKIANNVPQKPKVDPQIEQQQKSIDEQRTKLFNDQFSSQFGSWRNGKIQQEVKVLLNGRKLNEYQTATLGNKIVEEIKSLLLSDPQYGKDLQRHYDARNMDELLKFTKSRTEKHVQAATKKAYKELFSDPGKKPVPVPKPGQKTTAKPAAAATPQVAGWTKVEASKAPAPHEIDNNKTDFRMKFAKQAILKNGQKVYWGDKVPK